MIIGTDFKVTLYAILKVPNFILEVSKIDFCASKVNFLMINIAASFLSQCLKGFNQGYSLAKPSLA